ncbi:hypothetical protein L596_025517 [Steinernema carpocapsae]|uniref:Uncharacterized protein n=1 Tax=Steinernema carpocapsae TaxID=34508 RepID=A0A4U5M819_STECR|nr:hypothetical protein L596_025517 [Steinernema carpocapsae]
MDFNRNKLEWIWRDEFRKHLIFKATFEADAYGLIETVRADLAEHGENASGEFKWKLDGDRLFIRLQCRKTTCGKWISLIITLQVVCKNKASCNLWGTEFRKHLIRFEATSPTSARFWKALPKQPNFEYMLADRSGRRSLGHGPYKTPY